MKNTLTWLVLAVIVVVVIVLVTGNKKEDMKAVIEDGESITIGVSAPLTGEAASFGEGMIAGGQLAAQEVNADGGINGRELNVIFEDDACNSKEGTNAMNKLINIDNVSAVVGPLCSSAAGASLVLAQDAAVPVINFGSAPHLPSIGEYIFRTYPSDSFQGVYSANYIYEELDIEKVAVIYTKNDWGQGLRDVFTETFESLGGEIVVDEGVNQDATDIRTIATKVAGSDAELVYIPLYPANGVVSVKQLRDTGADLPLFGADALDAEEFTGSGVVDGVVYSRVAFNNPEEFKERIKQETDYESSLATPITYDAIHLLAQAMSEVGTEGEDIIDYLSTVEYEALAMPLVSFDEVGDLKSAEYELMQIVDGKVVPLSE